MKILVVGSGGREHALAWRLAQAPRVESVYVAPGNGGTEATPTDRQIRNIPITDCVALADFAQKEGIALTVVGPEAPLAEGIVDIFRSRGLKIFGPTRAAAQLESSKSFAKAFMKRHKIPTAEYEVFSDAAAAHEYIEKRGAPIVVKADGLAAGKGVVVAQTLEEAHRAIEDMFATTASPGQTIPSTEQNAGQSTGTRVVIEEFLTGEEASFIVLVDGKNVLPLASSQDHKRLLDGDEGPNTGGMGAYSPAPVVTPQIHARVMRDIILPTVKGMEEEGRHYTGFLYAGIMIDAQGCPKTLEFNCRLGDPETQPMMVRLKGDFAKVLELAIAGRLDAAEAEIAWDRRVALGVVVASEGYPQNPAYGKAIAPLPENTSHSLIFHAGTAYKEDQLVTSGGRVLCAVGLADSIKEARTIAYDTVRHIQFSGMQYRRDIGNRGLHRKT